MKRNYVSAEWKRVWKRPWGRVGILASAALLICTAAFAWPVVFANPREAYVASAGIGLAPKGMSGSQAKAMARRAAVVDLQHSLAGILGGGGPNGHISGVEILNGTWDGTYYRVSGRVRRDGVVRTGGF